MSKKRGKRHSGQSDDMGRHKPKPPARRPESDKPPSSAAWARSAMRYPDRASPIDTASIASCAAAGIVTVQPGEALDLAAINADADGGLDKEASKQALLVEHGRIQALQERLYAEHRRSLLVVLQAIDTGGKDGTIRSVFEGVNPQGCRVWSFKVPSAEERDHDFLWRYHAKVPGRGMIGVFNRSHYEDVLVVRVKSLEPEGRMAAALRPHQRFRADADPVGRHHAEVLPAHLEGRAEGAPGGADRRPREALEIRCGRPRRAPILGRLSERLHGCPEPLLHPHAPWHVVPANRKWYRNLLVARTIANTLEAMDPRYPDAQPGIAELTVPD